MNPAPRNQEFDVFLSYNSNDYQEVEAVDRALTDKGLKPFLDRSVLSTGRRFRPGLERAIDSVKGAAVFCGEEIGPWQHLEIDFFLDRAAREKTFPVIPVILPRGKPPLGFLKLFVWIDLRDLPTDEAVQLLIKAIRGERESPVLQEHSQRARAAHSPYRPLLPFREEDAPFFFGRDEAINTLTEKVRAGNFVALVGASGVGKSSVVRAGLLPKLRRDKDVRWEIATLVPNDEPLKQLARVLVPLLEPQMTVRERLEEAGKYADSFLAGKIRLVDLVEELVKKKDGPDRLLLVVDQWEELYALTKDAQVRNCFIEQLLAASAGEHLKVVITLRGDFMGEALANRALSERLQDAQVNLSHMRVPELEQAITRPAQETNLTFEPNLVKRILDDAGEEEGSLPPLEFVLDGLWRGRVGDILTHKTYDDLGGVKGVLARFGEEVYDKLGPKDQAAMQALFRRLIETVGGGKYTRRRVPLDDFTANERHLVKTLADKRLLVTAASSGAGSETVEIAHEALIWNWQRLKDWLKADMEFLSWRQRLQANLEQFVKGNGAPNNLLRAGLLKEAEFFLERQPADLNQAQISFIKKSRAHSDRIIRWVIYGSAGLTALATLSLLFAVTKWQQAEVLRGTTELANQRALSRQLAAQAEQMRNEPAGNLQRAAVYSMVSLRLSPSWEAGLTLRQCLANLPIPAGGPLSHSNGVMALAYTPDGKVLATASTNVIQLWNPSTGKPIGRPMMGEGIVTAMSFGPDGDLLAATNDKGIAKIWNTKSGVEETNLIPIKPLNHVAFRSPTHLVAASAGKEVRVLDLESGRQIASFTEPSEITTMNFSPDGDLGLGGSDGSVRMIVVVSNKKPSEEPIQANFTNAVLELAFSPDSKFVAVREGDSAWLWSFRERSLLPRKLPQDHVTSLAFARGGELMATASEDKSAMVWEINSLKSITQVRHSDLVSAVAFSPDGGSFATASWDSTARVWNATNGHLIACMVHEGVVRAVTFSPEGRRLATASEDGTAQIWEVTGFSETQPQTETRAAFAFSRTGDYFATADNTNAVVWETKSNKQVTIFPHLAKVTLIEFSPNARHLVTACKDKGPFVWDLTAGAQIQSIEPTNGVKVLAFSGDGRRFALARDDSAIVLSFPEGSNVCQIPHSRVWAMALNFRGTRLATAGPSPPSPSGFVTGATNKTASLWDVATGREITNFTHAKDIHGLTFTPDGQYLATASSDQFVSIWNSTNGEKVASLKQDSIVWAAAFSSDGNLLAVGCGNSSARIWAWREHSEIARIKHEKDVSWIAFSGVDDKFLATITLNNQTGRLWLWRPRDLLAEGSKRITYYFPVPELKQYLGGNP